MKCVCVDSLHDFSPIVSSHLIMREFPRLTSFDANSWGPPEAWVSMRWVIILSMCAFVEQKQSKHMCNQVQLFWLYIQWSSNIMCTIVYIYMVSPWFPLENTANDAGEKFSTVQTVWEGSPSTTWPKLQSGHGLKFEIIFREATNGHKSLATHHPFFYSYTTLYYSIRTAGQVPSLGFSEAAAASQTCTTQTGTSQGC